MLTAPPAPQTAVNGWPQDGTDAHAAVNPTPLTGQPPTTDPHTAGSAPRELSARPVNSSGHVDRVTAPAAVNADRPVPGKLTAPADRTARSTPPAKADRTAPGWWQRLNDHRAKLKADPLQAPLAKVSLFLSIMAVTVIVSWFAMDGQIDGAVFYGIPEDKAFAVPFLLEFAVLVLLLIGFLQGLALNPYWPYWGGAMVLTGIAAALNVGHAPNLVAGAIYGVSTVVTIGLWFVKLFTALMKRLRAADKMPVKTPRFSRRLARDYPDLVKRAQMIARRLSIETVQEALLLAEVWLRVYDSCTNLKLHADPKVAEQLARNTADDAVFRVAGHKVADIPTSVIVSRVNVDDQQPDPDEQPGASPEGHDTTPDRETEKAKPLKPKAPPRPPHPRNGVGKQRAKAKSGEMFDPAQMDLFADKYGHHITAVMAAMPDWATSPQPPSRREVARITGLSEGTANHPAKVLRYRRQQMEAAQ